MKHFLVDCFGVLILTPEQFCINQSPKHMINEVRDIFNAFNHGFISENKAVAQLSKILEIDYRELSGILSQQFIKNDKIIDFLLQHKHNGSKIAVLSNVAQYIFNQLFTDSECQELFDHLILSGNIDVAKPDKRFFELALNQTKLSVKDCIFIDDIESNLQPAKLLGLNTVCYRNFNEFLENIRKEENA